MEDVPVMGTTTRQRVRFSAERVLADMAIKGWNSTDLARAAGVSAMTISRFLRGEAQTPKIAGRIARALGYSVRRYFSHVEAA